MTLDWRLRNALQRMSSIEFDDDYIEGVGKGTYDEMIRRGWAEYGLNETYGKMGYRLTAEGKRVRDSL